MAITYGNSTSTDDPNPETDGTTLVAPTITGSDTVLLLFAIGNCSGLENPTTVTYDSVSISSNTLFTGFYVNYTQIHGWYVKNPGSAKNFFVDFGGSTLISDLTLVAVYYTGVDQSTTFRTASTGSGTSNPATVNVTNSQTNDLIAGCFGLNDVASDDGYTSGRVGAGQTYRGQEVGGVSNVQGAWCDEPGAGGTVTHSWDFVDNASAGFVVAAIPLIPAAGAGGRNPVPMGFVVE